MSNIDLQYQPIRPALYSASELLEGFDPNDPDSFARTRDFLIYKAFVTNGGPNSGDYLSTMFQSLHDNSITQALHAVTHSKKCVAMMGGHDMARNCKDFETTALLSRRLSKLGFLIASGGGPGAMEATHLGALFTNSSDSDLNDAFRLLASVPKLPDKLSEIVDATGKVNKSLVAQVHAWLKVAVAILNSVGHPGVSLSIPTWRYGQEPFTPFASNIAKYFQNSVREDGLISVGSAGIVFAPGKAGTIQEIFQNATNNYYHFFGTFTPMIFLGRKFWREDYPVIGVLEKLFTVDQVHKYILVTDSVDEIVDFIVQSRTSVTGVPRPTLFRWANARTPGLFTGD